MKSIVIKYILRCGFKVFKLFYTFWMEFLSFFFQQHNQTHVDSANHTGSSASINDKRQLFPCTACDTVRLWVMCPWYMNDLWAVETSLQKCYVFQIACKSWSLLWFWNHLHQLSTIHCKSNPELSKIPHTFYCP